MKIKLIYSLRIRDMQCTILRRFPNSGSNLRNPSPDITGDLPCRYDRREDNKALTKQMNNQRIKNNLEEENTDGEEETRLTRSEEEARNFSDAKPLHHRAI